MTKGEFDGKGRMRYVGAKDFWGVCFAGTIILSLTLLWHALAELSDRVSVIPQSFDQSMFCAAIIMLIPLFLLVAIKHYFVQNQKWIDWLIWFLGVVALLQFLRFICEGLAEPEICSVGLICLLLLLTLGNIIRAFSHNEVQEYHSATVFQLTLVALVLAILSLMPTSFLADQSNYEGGGSGQPERQVADCEVVLLELHRHMYLLEDDASY